MFHKNYIFCTIVYLALVITLTPLVCASDDFAESALIAEHAGNVPHIVYDIDHTVCERVKKRVEDSMLRQVPAASFVSCGKNRYFFFPGIEEVLLTFLDWNWKVSFFSSGKAERNKPLVESYIEFINSKYKGSDISIKADQFSVYSGDNRILEHRLKHIDDSDIHYPPAKVKNLSVICKNVDDIILIDDKLKNIASSQEPFLRGDLPKRVRGYYNTPDEVLLGSVSHAMAKRDYAAFHLGVLFDCKQLMEENAISLRGALKKVLAKVGQSAEQGDASYIQRGADLTAGNGGHERLRKWILKGHELINEMRRKCKGN